MVGVAVSSVVSEPLPQLVGEKRMVFYGLSWQEFLQIRGPISRSRNVRLTYNTGTLELTRPLERHEFSAELIAVFIRTLVKEFGLSIKSMGSTTIDKEILDRSAEPDKAYYIQNQHLVTGRLINFEQDPPPDLVVEVDITHTDIDKLNLYAHMGVPEFWRYNGRLWRIYQLVEGAYQEADVSPTFPQVEKTKLYEFLATAQHDEIKAEQALSNWVKAQLSSS